MPPTLWIYHGIPGSGKTTTAKAEIYDENGLRRPGVDTVRVNRDDIRNEIFTGQPFSKQRESAVRKIRDARIQAALENHWDVISDDTNLEPRTIAELEALAKEHNAEVRHRWFDTPFSVCRERNAAREGVARVPDDAMDRMEQQYRRLRHLYRDEWDRKLPFAVICDLDGTLAILDGRHPYDASTCETDRLNDVVCDAVYGLVSRYIGCEVIITTGRMKKDREPTIRWLYRNGIYPSLLLMRATDDMRKDSIVKREMYENHIRGKYNVLVAFDDRNQVVDLWRELGIPCFQVNEGSF